MADFYMDFKLLSDVRNLLQMRNVKTPSALCSDQERQMVQVAIRYGVQDCKQIVTPMEPYLDLQRSSNNPLVPIPFRHLLGYLL